MEKVEFIKEDNCYVFNCPHCNNIIQVALDQVNCKIFRHGQYKHNSEQVPPHSSKELCDDLVFKDLIYGCGKPFILIYGSTGLVEQVNKCDYI